jgi:hypothetical protein
MCLLPDIDIVMQACLLLYSYVIFKKTRTLTILLFLRRISYRPRKRKCALGQTFIQWFLCYLPAFL